MELIYMYLGNIKRPLANQGIHFGSKFHVDYNPERCSQSQKETSTPLNMQNGTLGLPYTMYRMIYSQ